MYVVVVAWDSRLDLAALEKNPDAHATGGTTLPTMPHKLRRSVRSDPVMFGSDEMRRVRALAAAVWLGLCCTVCTCTDQAKTRREEHVSACSRVGGQAVMVTSSLWDENDIYKSS